MAPTHALRTRIPRRRKVGVIVGVVIVVAAGVALARLTFDPLRANLSAAYGASCGTVTRFSNGGGGLLPGAPPPGGITNEQCLQRAAQRCHAATLDYVQIDMDFTETITLIIEPAVPALAPCDIAVVWGHNGGGGVAGLEHCASLALQTDGLHVYGCGSLGNIVVPA